VVVPDQVSPIIEELTFCCDLWWFQSFEFIYCFVLHKKYVFDILNLEKTTASSINTSWDILLTCVMTRDCLSIYSWSGAGC
jgi:hypothetical protein